MISTNYDINSINYGERIVEYRVYLIKVLAFFKKPLIYKTFKTGIIRSFNKTLLFSLVISEGIKTLVKQYDKATAQRTLSITQLKLKHYKKLYASLEEVKFFDNPETEEIAEKVLLNYYSIEAEVRNKALSDNTLDKDKELQSFASNLSLDSLTH